MRRATDGAAPRLATSFAAYYDSVFLTLLYSGADDHVVATHLEHDAPLYEEDVVEAFLAPAEGEVWRANFFRIDRHPKLGDDFSAWQPTMRTPPDFHVVGAFGTIRFI